jgi:hypothetical protein
MRVAAPRPTEMRLQRCFIEARLRSLDAIVRLRAAAWDWLELCDESLDDLEMAAPDGAEAGGAGGEAAAVVREAVEAVEAAAGEIRALGRLRLGTDATSRLSLEQWARNLSLCGKAAGVLLLSSHQHSLFWDDWEGDGGGGARRRLGGEGGAGAARVLRERLSQWVCQIVDEEQPALSGLHRVQAVLEVINQVAALPLRLPPVVLDASPPIRLDLRITPRPRSVLETPMGVGLVLTLEGSLVGSPPMAAEGGMRRAKAGGARDVAYVPRVLLLVTVEKVSEHDGTGTGAAAAEAGAGSSRKEMRFKLRCRGRTGAVHTTCLLSWPSPGNYLVSIVPQLVDAQGGHWDGGPATSMRVKVVPAAGT